MRLILALAGVVLVAGCSSVPVQQSRQEADPQCDYALMDKIDKAQSPFLVSRVWAHCPQVRASTKS